MAITCGGCTATWTSNSACHCSGCHLTWSGIELFDRHRHQRGETGGCVPPGEILVRGESLVLTDGIWRQRPMTDAEKLARFGPRPAA